MAIDALEFEENNDPSSAIDEIIAQPERLKDLVSTLEHFHSNCTLLFRIWTHLLRS